MLPVLVGRARECEVIDDLLASAAQGRSGALVIRGGTGVGKSALLEHALARATGFITLRATGVEAERDFAYAGLRQVLAPVLERLDLIPGIQAEALRGALELSPPAGVGRMYVGAAALSLLSSATDDAPVVVAIDDAQWLDEPSADALAFAARRLNAEGVAMLFAANHEVGSFAAEGIGGLPVTGLAPGDALALLHSLSPDVAGSVGDHLVAATDGNPLFLVQAATLLSSEQLAGRDPIPHPLPVGDGLARWYASRLDSMSEEGRSAAIIAAASDTGGVRVFGDGDADDPVAHGLIEAEEAGLLTVDGGRVGFVHPLVRSIVYAAATPPERRAAHRRLADVLREGRYHERRAWHLAASTVGTDDAVAVDIAAVAASASDRRAHAPAAALFVKAADLTTDPELRASWSTEAAWSFRASGWADRAAELTRRVVADTTDPVTRTRARSIGALIDLDAGAAPSMSALIEDADRIAADEPALAARALAIASDGVPADRSVELTSRGLDLAPGGSPSQAFATVARGRALARAGRVDEAAATIDDAAALLRGSPHLADDPEVLVAVVDGLAEVRGDLSSMEELLTVASRAAREHTLIVLPRALLHRSRIEHGQGRWRDAHIHGYEAARLFHETGQQTRAAAADAWLGFVEASFGHEEATRAVVGSLDDPIEARAIDRIQGVLFLALGQPERAAAPLRRFVATPPDGPVLLDVDPLSVADAVEATVRAGDAAELERVIGRLPLDHPDTELCARWIEATTSEAADAFDVVVKMLDGARPFLAARVLLAAGQHIRRTGAKREARESLRAALERFTSIEATPWAERTASELRATGERVDRPTGSSLDVLTPQELQAARLVAGGATYKEAAARMYLATKTVEYHLGKAYRKLGVRNKAELTVLIVREDAP